MFIGAPCSYLQSKGYIFRITFLWRTLHVALVNTLHRQLFINVVLEMFTIHIIHICIENYSTDLRVESVGPYWILNITFNKQNSSSSALYLRKFYPLGIQSEWRYFQVKLSSILLGAYLNDVLWSFHPWYLTALNGEYELKNWLM